MEHNQCQSLKLLDSLEQNQFSFKGRNGTCKVQGQKMVT